MQRYVETESQREAAIGLLKASALPFTLDVKVGKHRTLAQNRLQRMWCLQIAEHYGDRSPEDVRGWMKLHIGVPILREEDERFRAEYDRVIKPMSYEDKISIMQVPLDFPVTRLMTTKQKARYLDEVYKYFVSEGVDLFLPPEVDK